MGGSRQAEALARQRIRLRPDEYSLNHAKMVDISQFNYDSLQIKGPAAGPFILQKITYYSPS